jgi:hypothetical protein
LVPHLGVGDVLSSLERSLREGLRLVHVLHCVVLDDVDRHLLSVLEVVLEVLGQANDRVSVLRLPRLPTSPSG